MIDSLYIGSRHDTTPLTLNKSSSWIYMDALPNFTPLKI